MVTLLVHVNNIGTSFQCGPLFAMYMSKRNDKNEKGKNIYIIIYNLTIFQFCEIIHFRLLLLSFADGE